MTSLYALTQEAVAIVDLIDSQDGELTGLEDALARLDEISQTLPAKVDSYRKLMAYVEGRANAKREYAGKILKAAQVETNLVERLKSRLEEAMELAGERKIVTELFSCWIQKNGQPSIEWHAPLSELPEEYRKVTVDVDRKAALAALKDGRELPSGFTVTHGSHLRLG